MMLIAASWPSNSEAAVTKRTLWVGRYSARALYSADRSVMSVVSAMRACRCRSARYTMRSVASAGSPGG